jgi:hypothetical protein
MHCQILVQIPSTKFHEITPHGSRAVSCRRKDGRTDVTSLIVAFRSCFANAPIGYVVVVVVVLVLVDDDDDDDDDEDNNNNSR